jgi:hypothetical protein
MEEKKVPADSYMQKSVEEGSGRIKPGRCKEDGDEKLVEKNHR